MLPEYNPETDWRGMRVGEYDPANTSRPRCGCALKDRKWDRLSELRGAPDCRGTVEVDRGEHDNRRDDCAS